MAKDPKLFKNAVGAFYTKQLFYETAFTARENVLYTLKDDDHEGFPSIKRLYVEMEDISEYHFATEYFYSWKHYQYLLRSSWFREVIDEAREELSVKLSAKNLVSIKQKAENGDLKANQYLLERGWLKEKKSPVGRPSKEAIKAEANRMFEARQELDEDLFRILPPEGPAQ